MEKQKLLEKWEKILNGPHKTDPKDIILIESKENFQLNEGVMALPQSVYQDITDWVIEQYKIFKNTKKVDEKTKIFELDFSGTKFEFLNNNYSTKVKVHLFNNKNGSCGYFWEYDSDLNPNNPVKTFPFCHANVYLNFATDLENTLKITLEHELLHMVQYSIKHAKDIKNHTGGLAPKKYQDASLDTQGYKKGNPRVKRVQHAKRPIEFQTNLNSILRTFQNWFHDYLIIHPEEKNNIKTRSEFFKRRYKNFLTLKNPQFSVYYKLANIKKISKSFNSPKNVYHGYLKLLYKSFVYNEHSINFEQINKVLDDLEKNPNK